MYSTRSGEWGDHVTLQAAADRVSLIFIYLFSLSSLETSGKNILHYFFHVTNFLFSYSCTMLKMKQVGVVLLIGENSMYALLSHSEQKKERTYIKYDTEGSFLLQKLCYHEADKEG